MEYKIFGKERSPSDDFLAQLREFCNLDESQRAALAEWFQSATDFSPYTSELPAVIQASTLLPEQFRTAVQPIRFLLESWHRRSLELSDIERDLLLLGLSEEQLSEITRFLANLSGIKERVRTDALEGIAESTGLPTIDDANIVWDARPVFGGASFYYFDGDEDATMYDKCLGIRYMAIMELMFSDSSGVKERIAVQLSEDIFKKFHRAIHRSEAQLQSLKDFMKQLPAGPTTKD